VNGFFLDPVTLLYAADELVERNATWETRTYAHGFLAIGDTSGPDAILIRSRDDGGDDPPVYLVDVGTMTPDHMRPLAPSLSDWIERGCPLGTGDEGT
jgi:hypothetical protein